MSSNVGHPTAIVITEQYASPQQMQPYGRLQDASAHEPPTVRAASGNEQPLVTNSMRLDVGRLDVEKYYSKHIMPRIRPDGVEVRTLLGDIKANGTTGYRRLANNVLYVSDKGNEQSHWTDQFMQRVTSDRFRSEAPTSNFPKAIVAWQENPIDVADRLKLLFESRWYALLHCHSLQRLKSPQGFDIDDAPKFATGLGPWTVKDEIAAYVGAYQEVQYVETWQRLCEGLAAFVVAVSGTAADGVATEAIEQNLQMLHDLALARSMMQDGVSVSAMLRTKDEEVRQVRDGWDWDREGWSHERKGLEQKLERMQSEWTRQRRELEAKYDEQQKLWEGNHAEWMQERKGREDSRRRWEDAREAWERDREAWRAEKKNLEKDLITARRLALYIRDRALIEGLCAGIGKSTTKAVEKWEAWVAKAVTHAWENRTDSTCQNPLKAMFADGADKKDRDTVIGAAKRLYSALSWDIHHSDVKIDLGTSDVSDLFRRRFLTAIEPLESNLDGNGIVVMADERSRYQ